MEIEAQWRKRTQRPVGVYVWTALVIFKFGLLNFIGYFISARSTDGEAYLPYVVFSFALCLFTAGAAIWACSGDNSGRIAFIVLAPLNIAWVLFLVIPTYFNETIPNEIRVDALYVIIQQIFLSLWMVGMIWYFMSEKVVAYYKQNE